MFAALLIFVALVVAGYAATSALNARQEAKEALERRFAMMTGASGARRRTGVLKDRRLSTIAFVNNLLPRLAMVKPLVRMIERAGLKKRVGEVLLYVPLAACGGFAIVTGLTGRASFGFIAGVVGATLPVLAVRRMARKRTAAFAEPLPDALDLVRAALQAGHGLMAALGVVAEEFPDPIAQEFHDVVEEVRLGRPLREALDNLAEHVDNPHVALLEVGILTAQDVGGNLAEVIDKVSYTIRERFKLQRDVQVMTAQGRMSGGVLTALPFLAGLGLMAFSPGYFTALFEQQKGHYMLAYALFSLLVGHFAIRRIVRIEV